jgi:arabinoxylan arabinofuranohydrolase
MKKYIPIRARFIYGLFFIMGLIASLHGYSQKLISPGYQFNSDPTCREINGQFYLFTSHDPFTVQFEKDNTYFIGMYDYHAYSTTDFDHWVDHGSILNTHDAKWHKGNAVWDGDAGIPANGKYYAYIPFRSNPDSELNYGIFEIGVFISDNPEGPYIDALGTPIKTFDGKNLIGLSPTVIYDKNEPYLLWGAGDQIRIDHYIMIAKLKPNMIELAEPAREILVEINNSCGGLEYFESPIMFKHNDLWYMTYIAFNSDWVQQKGPNCNFTKTDPKGSYIQYCTSKSMFGPFNKNPKHWIYPGSGGIENNHQGVAQYKGKWYVGYHTPYQNIHRQACVTEFHFNDDGSLVPIYPDIDPGAGTPSVSILTLDAFANKREAEEFHARFNADDEIGVLRDYHFKMKNGGYLRFNNMDFGKGATGFKIEVSCENPELKDGIIEFRLDNPFGTKIGEAKVFFTKGKTDYIVLKGPVKNANGIHDIFIVTHGSGGDNTGHLFNINWFTFTR